MARISRRNLIKTEEKKTLSSFRAGIYTRLSQERTEEWRNKSSSIESQIEICQEYANSENMNLVKVYTDYEYSGTNFDRPDFKRMINDIELGKINLIITKDLSRLGRDYIDTGYYVEKYFPLKNVRYIALNDNIDTFDANNSSNDMTPFKSVINDIEPEAILAVFHKKLEKVLLIHPSPSKYPRIK